MNNERDLANVAALEEALDYEFTNPKLLLNALMHKSYVNYTYKRPNYNQSNEKLEFLGDRVLGLVMSRYLYQTLQDSDEGTLAFGVAYLNSTETLSEIAKQINLQNYVYIHDITSEVSLQKIYANAVEAILAAIYLDSNLVTIERVILRLWGKHLKEGLTKEVKQQFNPKSLLQEWTQRKNLPMPLYEDVKTEGEAHAPVFYLRLSVKGYKSVEVKANNKKIAQKIAATEFIKANALKL